MSILVDPDQTTEKETKETKEITYTSHSLGSALAALANTTSLSTLSDSSTLLGSSSSTSSSVSCSCSTEEDVPKDDECTCKEVACTPPPPKPTPIISRVLIMKTTGNLEIPSGIKTVLVEGNKKKVHIQLPNKEFKCVNTELGEICSSVPITVVNIGHSKVVVQAPKGRSIYQHKRITIKQGESATFQALGSIWYNIF